MTPTTPTVRPADEVEDAAPIVVLDHPEEVAALPAAPASPSSPPPTPTTGVSHGLVSTVSPPPCTSPGAPAAAAVPATGRRHPRSRRGALPAPAAASPPADDPQRCAVLGRVAALARLDLAGLRDEWRRLYGTEPPGLGREFMRRRLAYRVQELAYGGLSEAIRERLRQIEAQAKAKPPKRRDGIPAPGTLLVREFKGVRHEVTVLADGFSFQGRPWRSLSAIARDITGGHRDGPLFFGLRARRRPGGPT